MLCYVDVWMRACGCVCVCAFCASQFVQHGSVIYYIHLGNCITKTKNSTMQMWRERNRENRFKKQWWMGQPIIHRYYVTVNANREKWMKCCYSNELLILRLYLNLRGWCKTFKQTQVKNSIHCMEISWFFLFFLHR